MSLSPATASGCQTFLVNTHYHKHAPSKIGQDCKISQHWHEKLEFPSTSVFYLNTQMDVHCFRMPDSHLDGFSTSVGHPGYCHSPVIAVKNVDVGQPILLDISTDSAHISSGSHTFYLHVQHCSCHMAIISTSCMSIPS